MRIVVTGATGQLGSQLIECIKEGRNALGPVSQTVKDAEVTGFGSRDLDIADLDALRKAFGEAKPDIVINCAAYTDVDGCESGPDKAFRVNTLGARNIATASGEVGAKLVHISTDYVFSGEGTVPFREYDLPAPQSVYGKSKNMGEEAIRECTSRHFIMRTSWLYGRNGKNFVKTILRAARERGSLQVVDDQRGNPTNVEDLVYHILKVMETEHYGTYHCTGEGEGSWYDFAKKIVEFAGIDATVAPVTTDKFPRPAKRPAYSSLDNMMLRVTVGDHMRPWEEALREFILETGSGAEVQK
jgi:dTDP-4-dehydrorhamnose reductase